MTEELKQAAIVACRECLKADPGHAPYKVMLTDGQTDGTVLTQMRRHLLQRHTQPITVAVKLTTEGLSMFGYPDPTVGQEDGG